MHRTSFSMIVLPKVLALSTVFVAAGASPPRASNATRTVWRKGAAAVGSEDLDKRRCGSSSLEDKATVRGRDLPAEDTDIWPSPRRKGRREWFNRKALRLRAGYRLAPDGIGAMLDVQRALRTVRAGC